VKRSSGEVDDDAGATQVDEGDERLAECKPKLRSLTSLTFESDSQWPRDLTAASDDTQQRSANRVCASRAQASAPPATATTGLTLASAKSPQELSTRLPLPAEPKA
jgi:hypothetical protein